MSVVGERLGDGGGGTSTAGESWWREVRKVLEGMPAGAR